MFWNLPAARAWNRPVTSIRISDLQECSMRLPFAAIACLCLALFVPVSFAQPKKAKPTTTPAAAEDAEAEAAQQRTVAISLVSTLADEARSFKDQTRRARVQARAADVLWDTDP